MTVQGGIGFTSAWQLFSVRSLSSLVALTVARRSTLTVLSPFDLTLLYTHNVCLSMPIMHKLRVPILCNLYT